MNDRVRRYYERGQRCVTVFDTVAGDFAPDSRAAALASVARERLADLATLDVEKANSTSKRQHGSAGRKDAREALQKLVFAVTDTAEAATPDRPEIKDVFRLPSRSMTDQTLIATARSFADLAPPFVEVFVEFHLPATSVNDLRTKANAMEAFISTQNEGVGARVSANAAAQANVRGLNEALERLDVIMHNKYGDVPAVLAQWESAYHVEAAPGSRRKTNPDGNGTPPPDGTPPPTGGSNT